jgi:hypothetical protein
MATTVKARGLVARMADRGKFATWLVTDSLGA